jgi:hypothetical protein
MEVLQQQQQQQVPALPIPSLTPTPPGTSTPSIPQAKTPKKSRKKSALGPLVEAKMQAVNPAVAAVVESYAKATPPPKAKLSTVYDDEDWYSQYTGGKTGVGAGWQGTPYKYTPKEECHKGNVHIFDYVNDGATLSFFAGGTTRGSIQQIGQVLIALQSHDDGDITPVTTQGISLPSLSKYVARVIHIDVPDQGAPKLPLAFWYDLIDALNAVAKKEQSKKLEILVRCAGGHGRTGTIMCILAWLCDATGGEEPVAWLRKVYCKEVVESNTQFNYIQLITGQVSKEVAHPFVQVAVSPPPIQAKANPSPLPGTSLPAVSTSAPSTDTGAKPTAVTGTSKEAKPALGTLYPPTWLDVKDLYVPHWPRVVEWDNACNKWRYEYPDGKFVISRCSPLIAGVDTEGVLDNLDILRVGYGYTACTVTVDDAAKTTVTIQEERPDEASLEMVEYVSNGACWEYTILGDDGFPILLHLDPCVYGNELIAGKWYGLGAKDDKGGEFVESVLYVDEKTIEVNLLNHMTVYLDKEEGGTIKVSTSVTCETVSYGI